MPTLLQIDSCFAIRSTGRIVESIGLLAKAKGWMCYAAHGARFVGKSELNHFQVTSICGEYIHYAQSLLFDNHGLNSTLETKHLVERIKEIKPDIIQFHCLHGYYLNYEVLFEYLNNTNVPVVWTFHDCWAFTGHCCHFDFVGCMRWKSGCYDCPIKGEYPKSIGLDRAKRNYRIKNDLFTKTRNLTIIPVSYWMEGLVKDSFFKCLPNLSVCTIHNGTNLKIFHPFSEKENASIRVKYGVPKDNKVVMGCATPWTFRKGFSDFFRLRMILPNNISIILVGLSSVQVKEIPAGIIGIKRTESAHELAQLYSASDIFLNPTYEDNFPTVNIEALACGTPVITYNTGGSPESIDEKTGAICRKGDVDQMGETCMKMLENSSTMKDECRYRAEFLYDSDKCFQKYIDIYESILKRK